MTGGVANVYKFLINTHNAAMRTNIEIDDDLMAEALKASGCKTKKAAVEEGLRLLVSTRRQARLRALRGRLRWEGSLDEMRRDR